MSLKKPILLLFFIIIFSSFVSAAEVGIFDDVFSSIVPEGFNFAHVYEKYGMFIDMIIYLVLFIGVAQATLMKRFEGTGGKTVVVVVGIMLAVGLSVWANEEVNGEPRFMIKDLGPITGALFALIIFSTVYSFVKGVTGNHGFGDKATAGLVAWIFIYYAMQSVFPSVFEFMYSVPFIGPLLGIFTHIAVIAAIFLVVKRFSKGLKFWGKETPTDTSDIDTGFNQAEQAIEKAEEAIEQTQDVEEDITETEDQETKIETKMFKTLDEFYRHLIDLKQGKNVKEELKGIKGILKTLLDELKQLKTLEDKECKQEESILERIKVDGQKDFKDQKVVQLLQKEKSFLNAFEKLLLRAMNTYYNPKAGGIDHAAMCIEQAKRVLQELIFLNEVQKKEN